MSRHRAAQLLRLMRDFFRAREAVAAVEFALVMPLLLTMYLGSTELSQLINIDQRIVTIAGTVGDLVARENGEIDSGPLADYFQAAQAILSPFSTNGLAQVVSVVYVASNGTTTKILWSQASAGGTARTVNQPYSGIPTELLSITKGTTAPYIIVSEASYSYKPLLGLFFKQPFGLYHQSFYLPRYAAMICYNAATCTSS
jgi:Flp pilus assembly protein TadG